MKLAPKKKKNPFFIRSFRPPKQSVHKNRKRNMCNIYKYYGVLRLTNVSELHWQRDVQTAFAQIVHMGTRELIGCCQAWRRKVLHTRPGHSHPAQLKNALLQPVFNKIPCNISTLHDLTVSGKKKPCTKVEKTKQADKMNPCERRALILS